MQDTSTPIISCSDDVQRGAPPAACALRVHLVYRTVTYWVRVLSTLFAGIGGKTKFRCLYRDSTLDSETHRASHHLKWGHCSLTVKS